MSTYYLFRIPVCILLCRMIARSHENTMNVACVEIILFSSTLRLMVTHLNFFISIDFIVCVRACAFVISDALIEFAFLFLISFDGPHLTSLLFFNTFSLHNRHLLFLFALILLRYSFLHCISFRYTFCTHTHTFNHECHHFTRTALWSFHQNHHSKCSCAM